MVERQESGRVVVTYLYRAFGEDGQLLYVGIAGDLEARLKQHMISSVAWIGQVVTLSAEKYYSRESAHAAESRAIKTEGPIYNIHGSPTADSARFLAWLAEHVRYAKPRPVTEAERHARFAADFDEYLRIWRLARQAKRQAIRINYPGDPS